MKTNQMFIKIVEAICLEIKSIDEPRIWKSWLNEPWHVITPWFRIINNFLKYLILGRSIYFI
jgi:hypothetical protein